ncbi:MAG: exodeoxyribonuclease VII small subunit [Candidatus Omnitrophota bacterium]
MKDMKFEDAMKKLDSIVAELERGDISLEKSLERYEEGVGLARVLREKLEEAKAKVEMLVKSKDGKLKPKPFDVDEDNGEGGGMDSPRRKTRKKQEEDGELF